MIKVKRFIIRFYEIINYMPGFLDKILGLEDDFLKQKIENSNELKVKRSIQENLPYVKEHDLKNIQSKENIKYKDEVMEDKTSNKVRSAQVQKFKSLSQTKDNIERR